MTREPLMFQMAKYYVAGTAADAPRTLSTDDLDT